MADMFYRDGSQVSEQDLQRINMRSRGESGYIVKHGPCSRCGGEGGSHAWKHTGYVCYRCGGDNSRYFERYENGVYTAKRLEQLNAIAERKRLKKLAAARAKAETQRQDFIAWAKAGGRYRGDLIGRILRTGKPQRDGFVHDLARKLRQRWTLSDAQLSAARNMFAKIDEREIQDASSVHVGSIKERIEFEGIVEFETTREGFYGTTHIIKVRSIDGNVFTWFASGYQSLHRGDRVAVRGTVKKHDEYQGVKQTILSRCKITKFETMTADEAAEASTLTDGNREIR